MLPIVVPLPGGRRLGVLGAREQVAGAGGGQASDAATTAAAQVVSQEEATWNRRLLFVYNLVILGVLVLLAWAYFRPSGQRWSLVDLVPGPLQGIPVYAAWFGALGGVVISLKGIYDHGVEEWQVLYNMWHLGRPFSGAIAGGVTYLLLRALSTDNPQTSVVLAAAFVVGTQERRFFNLLSEVARVVVQSPSEADEDALMVTEVHPDRGSGPDEGREATKLTILGRGFDAGARVLLNGQPLENRVVSRDGTTITGTVPRGSGPVEILVVNPSGAARLLSGKFEYASATLDDARFEPEAVGFGAVPVGQASDPHEVTVTNRGTAELRIARVSVTGTHSGDFTMQPPQVQDVALKPGESSRVGLVFRPQGQEERNALLSFVGNGSPRHLPLSGTGIPPGSSGDGAGIAAQAPTGASGDEAGPGGAIFRPG